MLIQSAAAAPTQGVRHRPAVIKKEEKPSNPDSFIGDIIKRDPQVVGGVVGVGAYTLATAYPSTWAHEMGHAVAIEHLYTNGQPSVDVFPFNGGVTRWRPSELSPLGQKLGADGARALVSASGTLVDLGIATTSFGVGFKLRKKHPIIGHALMGYGAMTVLNSALYAGSAVGGDLMALAAKGNDFASIGVRAGIPPIASVAILASVLPLQYAAMKWLEDRAAENKEEAKPASPFIATPQRNFAGATSL